MKCGITGLNSFGRSNPFAAILSAYITFDFLLTLLKLVCLSIPTLSVFGVIRCSPIDNFFSYAPVLCQMAFEMHAIYYKI